MGTAFRLVAHDMLAMHFARELQSLPIAPITAWHSIAMRRGDAVTALKELYEAVMDFMAE